MSTSPPLQTPDDPLRSSLQYLKGVGPARADLIRRLGLETVGDLLFHFPRSYEDLSDVRAITALAEGKLQTVRGEVVEIEGRYLADGRAVVSVVLSDDGKHCLEGVWFNQTYAARRFRYGQQVAFSGKPKWFRDHWQMTTPRVQSLDGKEKGESQILPVYPLTADLRPDQLRAVLRGAVDRYAASVPELLPDELRRRHSFPDVRAALENVHFPMSLDVARAARRRFAYEEFLVLQLALALRRRDLRGRQQAPMLPVTPLMDSRIRRLFPFRLTADQDRAVGEVCRDLAGDRPMQRLLQADVGAGKTAVAVYALLVTVANKHQAALMAPTEVLAQQHWRTLETYLAHSRVRRLLLTGGLTPRQRRDALRGVRVGEVDLVVGTQALVQEDVEFARLGLVVIDEQHRFGVNQRARVRRLGVDPHYLVMSATPIPRTVALTVFGDLDVSFLREPPPGRLPVVTRWVSSRQRDRVYRDLRDGLAEGRQAFVVCPLVAESETLDVANAEETKRDLQAGIFQDFRVGLLHGRLDDAAKDRVMQDFRGRQVDVLVTTSVVEVGVDVPNATLLVVEHADRFGLAQLHQLRGRISRGAVAGKCFLISDPANEEARERLRALSRSTDGFALAEMDARLRGLGELFGTKQHGLGELRFGDLVADRDLLQQARKDAFALVAADARLDQPQLGLLKQRVYERYGKTLDLPEVG